jgi:hypothetical protein
MRPSNEQRIVYNVFSAKAKTPKEQTAVRKFFVWATVSQRVRLGLHGLDFGVKTFVFESFKSDVLTQR